MGFNLADIALYTFPIVSIKLVIYRTFWSGSMEVVFTETEDDVWENSSSSRFPSLTYAQEVIRASLSGTGYYKSEDIQDYILEQYNSGDYYLSIIMSTESTSENGSFSARETTGRGPYLEVLYGYPSMDLSTTSEQTETALNGMQLDLEIADGDFTKTELTPDMFTLDSVSQTAGVTVSSVNYIDSTHARLALAFTSDVDEHYDLAVTVDGGAISSGQPLTSNVLAIHAYDEITQGGTYDLDDFGALPDVRVYTTEPVTFIQTSAEKENCVIRNMVTGVDLELAGVNINNDVSGSGAGIIFMGTGNTVTLTGKNGIYTYNDPYFARAPGRGCNDLRFWPPEG